MQIDANIAAVSEQSLRKRDSGRGGADPHTVPPDGGPGIRVPAVRPPGRQGSRTETGPGQPMRGICRRGICRQTFLRFRSRGCAKGIAAGPGFGVYCVHRSDGSTGRGGTEPEDDEDHRPKVRMQGRMPLGTLRLPVFEAGLANAARTGSRRPRTGRLETSSRRTRPRGPLDRRSGPAISSRDFKAERASGGRWRGCATTRRSIGGADERRHTRRG